jgi:hypothetical protein
VKFLFRCVYVCLLLVFLFICLAVVIISAFLGRMSNSMNGDVHGSAIVQAALAMAEHLHNCGPEGYDQCYDSGFPRAALLYWQQICPGCAAWANGNLQCVMFVAAAYALGGDPLETISNAVDFWPNYQRPEMRAKGWVEIPNGTGLPLPGDMVVMASPFFGGVGHIAVVTAVTPPLGGRDGQLTFAQANGPGPLNTFPLPPDLQLHTWPGYTVLGYIRHLRPGLVLPSLPRSPYVAVAYESALQAGINPVIFLKQIEQESGFNPLARSPAGAEGIAQLLPSTAQALGVDPWNPAQALQGAARLMAQYLHRYGGDYAKALAAYNAGSGAVDAALAYPNWLDHLPDETRRYVLAILS